MMESSRASGPTGSRWVPHWTGAMALAMGVVLVVAGAAYHEFHEAYLDAEQENHNLALLLAQHTEAAFDKTRMLIQEVQLLTEFRDLSRLPHRDLSALLAKMKSGNPEIEALALVNAEGYEIGNSATGESTADVYVGDRSYFLKHRADPGLRRLISEPVFSRSTGSLVVADTVKAPSRDGKFNGLIFATLNLQAFSDFFSHLNPGPNGVIALLSKDRLLLARYPFIQEQIGREQIGMYDLGADGIPRLYSSYDVQGVPLTIVVGRATQDILHGWWRQQGVSLVLVSALIVSILLGFLFYIRQIREAETGRAIAMQASKLSSLGELSANIAHEINNPLTVISGRANLIIKRVSSGEGTPDDLKEIAEKILKTSNRIEKIIAGLRNFSRNTSADPKSQVPVQTIVETAVELTQSRMRKVGISLRMQPYPTGPSAAIFCNEAQIVQVLVNLLNNACDAVVPSQEKWVEIGFSLGKDSLQISIVDSGPGVSPENQKKLMHPFFTTKPKNQGTGLGLSISKRIIEEHQGVLWFDPAHKNTRFVVELPL